VAPSTPDLLPGFQAAGVPLCGCAPITVISHIRTIVSETSAVPPVPYTIDLALVAGQAAFLSERIDPSLIGMHADQDWYRTESLIQRWRQTCAGGDQETFLNRLSLEDLDERELRRRIAPLSYDGAGPLPAWVGTFAEALAGFGEPEPNAEVQADRYGIPGELLSRDAVVLPFLNLAERRLRESAGSLVGRFQVKAFEQLSGPLKQHLSILVGPVLERKGPEFAGNRDRTAQDPVAKGDAAVAGEEPNGRLQRLFGDYPVLARLLATATEQWVGEQQAFMTRLDGDSHALGRAFLDGREPGDVVSVEGGLSDRHRGGRSACIVTFSSGLKLVYKPKPMQNEQIYNRLLDWLNDRSTSGLQLKTLTVLPRDGYGWVEFVERTPCRSVAEAAGYFRRCGALLAVMHVLRGSDCHVENLVPCGDQPVLVDMETIVQPEIEAGEENPASQFASAAVLRTAMLPDARFDRAGRIVDSGALNSIGSEMAARLGDRVLLAQDYEREILDGFEEMGRRIIVAKADLLAADGPLAAFAGQAVRLVVRSTRIYGALLRKALHPDHLRDGARYGIHLDSLSRLWIRSSDHRKLWPALKSELASLEAFDIPLFHTTSDSTALLYSNGGAIDGFSTRSGCDSVRDLIERLDESTLQPQLELIRAVLRLHAGAQPRIERGTGPVDEGAPRHAETAPQVARALEIAHALASTVVRVPGYGPTWVKFNFDEVTGESSCGLMGESLFDGRAGTALFLAAAAAVTGETHFRTLAVATLAAITKMLEEGRIKRSLGGCCGLGSLLYVFSTCSDLLGADAAQAGAAAALAAIERESIESDDFLDVVSGGAGTLLALVRHAKATGSAEAAEKAGWCAQRLLATRRFDGGGFCGWPLKTHGREAFCAGFSHGVAGIALALGAYHSLTHDRTAMDAAIEAVALENSLLDPATGRWRLFDGASFADGSPLYRTNWCHGAPGIALSRLGLNDYLGTRRFDEDIRLAMKATVDFDGPSADHLCCGSMGRSSVLDVVGVRTGAPDLVEHARKIARATAQAADERSAYVVYGNMKREPQCPGFFQGTSGIGYEFLRSAFPDRLPCVLMLE
jgi:lantibiotic modifying enzyme